ncbi:MAG: hypothetical protein L0H96_18920 [Humibacillus sp.]|nr:hypothetical protein [Humibacillus sp.]MDN5778971.1 hypothetical protein [Humibacillus sp.]
MTEVEDVIAQLLGPPRTDGRLPRAWSSAEVRAAEGLAHLAYGDPDHTFTVTVTRVSRRRLLVPDDIVGTMAGVGIRLIEVVVGHDVRVTVTGASPRGSVPA